MSSSRSGLQQRLSPKSFGLCIFILALGAQLLCLGYFYRQAYVHKEEDLRMSVSQFAKLASLLVNTASHEQLSEPGQVESTLYKELLAPLVRFHLAMPDIHYLYTMRVDSDLNEYFILDTATNPRVKTMLHDLGLKIEASGLMEPYPLPNDAHSSDAHEAMLSGRPYVYRDIYEDEYGSFISAQAPLINEKGEYLGYLGVDYDVRALDARMNALKRHGGITIVFCVLLSGVIAYNFYRLHAETVSQLNLLYQKEEGVRMEKERAEAAVLAKTDLLSIAVHDLKNPLNAILGLSEILLMEREELSEEHQDCVEHISSASEKLLTVVSGILANEGLERDGMTDTEDLDLSQLVELVVSFNLFGANKKAITFDLAIEPKLWTRGDPLRLREAIDNLVSNAVKYSPMESTIRVKLESVDQAKFVQLTVIDDGAGLSEEDKKGLFKKFSKLSTKPTGGESSSGLGLSIVKTIVLMHEGFVGCDSQLGKGSSFWIKLPQKRGM